MSSSRITTQYPQIGLTSTVLFGVLVVAWWLEVGLRQAFFASIRFEFLMALLCIVMALVRSGQQKRRPGPSPNGDIMKAIMALMVVQGLSLPLAFNFDIAWAAYFNRSVKYAILGLLISQYVVSPFTLRAYLFSSFVAFFKIGQESFLGKITGSMVWESQGVPRLFGIQGSMFGHPNSLSGKMVSMVPFIWYLYPSVRSWWMRALLLIQVVFAINIIIFTASRTGYLTFIASAFIAVMLSKRNKGRALVFIMTLCLAAVLFVPEEYQERFESAFTGVEKEGHSADTRKGLFFDSLSAFASHPLGLGGENFPLYQDSIGHNAQETHNLYTQVLVETGIQGALFFAILVTVVLKKLMRTRRRLDLLIEHLEAARARAPPHDQPEIQAEIATNKLLYGTANAVILFTIVRLLLGFLGHDLFEIYWWIAAGLAMALYNMLLVAEKRGTELAGAPVSAPVSSRQPGYARRPVVKSPAQRELRRP